MRIELKAKLCTPYGKVDKIIIRDNELIFVTQVKRRVQSSTYPYNHKVEYDEHEYSFGDCTILVKEDAPPECDYDDKW